MEVELTKQDYAEARDAFAGAAAAVESLMANEFNINVPDDVTDMYGFAEALDEYGYYMTGSDYRELEEARQLLARLAGLNAARAV